MIVLSRLIREDTIHEQVRTDDGKTILRTFLRDVELDHEQTAEEAGDWCDTVLRCGGTVNRRVTSWPVKAAP